MSKTDTTPDHPFVWNYQEDNYGSCCQCGRPFPEHKVIPKTTACIKWLEEIIEANSHGGVDDFDTSEAHTIIAQLKAAQEMAKAYDVVRRTIQNLASSHGFLLAANEMDKAMDAWHKAGGQP